MAYNPAERLRPPKVNAMLADLSHLHAGLRASAEHHNDGCMLAVSLGLLAVVIANKNPIPAWLSVVQSICRRT